MIWNYQAISSNYKNKRMSYPTLLDLKKATFLITFYHGRTNIH
jgi:hypothetical protein